MILQLVIPVLFASACSAVQVETKYGTVEGLTETLVDDYHIGIELNTFYSIPFAKPPVGDLRFEPPQEPEPYDDVFVADRYGSACEQRTGALIWLFQPDWSDFSEDCLHLSIYAPADQSNGPYPVMVFFYGGAYQWGSEVTYLGHFLAAHGVVVVIPNYRLGIFGFAWSGDDVIPGNMGLMDQALAMRYVQENIADFGGDPDMVTIFGESAGAASVGFQMMSPKTEGLFHRTILESGCEYSDWALNGPQHEPENYLLEVAENLECPIEDSEEMATCLRNKTVTELLRTRFTCSPGRTCLGFAPVVDGEDGYLPDTPKNLRMRGEFHQVSELIGINRHESFREVSLPGMANMTYEDFEERIRESVADAVPAFPNPDREEDVAQAILFYYSPWPHLEDSYQLRHQYGEITTDTSFGVTSDQQAKEHREYAPTYYYVFDYVSEDSIPEYLGTPHGMEVSYVFGYPFLPQNPDVANQTGISSRETFDDLDREYSFFILTMWTNFAKYGIPTPEPVESPGEHDAVMWDTFTEENLSYLYIGRDVLGMEEDFRQHEYAFWQEYMAWMQLGDELPFRDNSCPVEECLFGAFLPEDYYDEN